MNVPNKYFRMFTAGDFGIAFSSPKIDSVELIPNTGVISSWSPLDLFVKPGEWEGPLADYIHNDLGVRLCSKRLIELLEKIRSDDDKVQWLPAYVTDLEGNQVEYYVLHFPEPPDVLNLAQGETIYDKDSGVLIRPCISQDKAEAHRIFNIPGLYITTIVDESVKVVLELEGMTGIEFSPIRTR
jgi:hypothetical protein